MKLSAIADANWRNEFTTFIASVGADKRDICFINHSFQTVLTVLQTICYFPRSFVTHRLVAQG